MLIKENEKEKETKQDKQDGKNKKQIIMVYTQSKK